MAIDSRQYAKPTCKSMNTGRNISNRHCSAGSNMARIMGWCSVIPSNPSGGKPPHTVGKALAGTKPGENGTNGFHCD